MDLPAPRLVVVTDTRATRGRPLVALVERALQAAGARGRERVAVQLRDRHLSPAQLAELGRALRALTHRHGVRLYVNDRVELALALAADGVQVGRASLPPGLLTQMPPKLEVAYSAHSVNELLRADALGCKFALLGPIFETPAKKGILGPIGVHVLSGRIKFRMSVLAIGGINESNCNGLDELGFHGAACIGSVLGAERVELVTSRILQAFP